MLRPLNSDGTVKKVKDYSDADKEYMNGQAKEREEDLKIMNFTREQQRKAILGQASAK